MYQTSPKLTYTTAAGQPVYFEPNFATTPKSVAVYVGVEYAGTYPNRTAAIVALGLVEHSGRKA